MRDRLVAYVSAVEPSWPGSLRGASAAELQHLCTLAGMVQPPPAAYKAWTEFAGHDDGGLISKTLTCAVAIKQLILHYEDLVRNSPQEINPQLPIVALMHLGDELSFGISDLHAEPQIRETCAGQDQGFFAASWEHLVFQCAVTRCEREHSPHMAAYGSSPNDTRMALQRSDFEDPTQLVAELLTSLGLKHGWFNDARHVFGFSEQVVVIMSKGRGNSVSLSVTGTDPKAVRTIGGQVAGAVGGHPVAFDRWR